MLTNMDQYGLESKMVDALVCDLAHHPWRQAELFDAIICDPPYGIRAGAKKIGKREGDSADVPRSSNPVGKYPETVPYEMDQVIVDLLDFASFALVPGGRLVFWLPTVREEYVKFLSIYFTDVA